MGFRYGLFFSNPLGLNVLNLSCLPGVIKGLVPFRSSFMTICLFNWCLQAASGAVWVCVHTYRLKQVCVCECVMFA